MTITRGLTATIAVGLMLAITGCADANTTEPATPGPAVTVTATATATVTATVTAEPSTPEPKGGPLKLAKAHTGTDVTVTAHKVKASIADETFPTVTAVNVELCVTADIDTEVSSGPWSLVDDDSGRWQSFSTSPHGGLPGPAYPEYVPLGRGECVKGWIYFGHDKGVKIVEIRYDGGSNSVRWKI